MIRYFPQPSLTLGPFRWPAFTLLVIAAVTVGFWTVVWRAERIGMKRGTAARLACTIILCGFLGAHIDKLTLPYPQRWLANPLVSLFPFVSLASFGGLLGGLLGGIWWTRRHSYSWPEVLRTLDVVAWAFPFAWIFGRMGCALAHDHRGRYSAHWIAVQYPEGARFNLGLIELLFTAALALLFFVLGRRPRPVGLYFGLLGVIYGVFRLWLDTLHLDPPRLLGVTLASISTPYI